MPIHPHECVACNHTFDVLTFRLSTIPDPTCPTCGRPAERRFGVPRLRTDTTFYAGVKMEGGQFDNYCRPLYTQPAKDAGVSINGKHYQHGLARFPGDPEAWVDNLGDVKRILEKRGHGCEELGVKPHDPEPTKRPPMSKKIVDDCLAARVQAGKIDPGDVEKYREQVTDEITLK